MFVVYNTELNKKKINKTNGPRRDQATSSLQGLGPFMCEECEGWESVVDLGERPATRDGGGGGSQNKQNDLPTELTNSITSTRQVPVQHSNLYPVCIVPWLEGKNSRKFTPPPKTVLGAGKIWGHLRNMITFSRQVS